ncbi:unknown protein [Microcystis aeruginosa NIES-843]|uniref:Uncharacterized protein n=1 Tax=Microcystis aeruginosa (strain NIES-843 / IAM M-2473) TaxID=449447 RepID=B0JKY0_MICAN|nr:unknown protein [Microcystis aeruginosa NIES-843]
MFQSLIGFKINWNFLIIADGIAEFRFQSLIGFKINWNFNYCRWNCRISVSIPNRV